MQISLNSRLSLRANRKDNPSARTRPIAGLRQSQKALPSVTQQLDLPFEERVQSSWTAHLGKPGSGYLKINLTDAGAVLGLVGARPSESGETEFGVHWSMAVRVRPPVQIKTTHFQMPARLFDGAHALEEQLDSSLSMAMKCGLQMCRSLEESVAPYMVQMKNSLRKVQLHLASLLVSSAAQAASRFPQSGRMRWAIYELGANDPTGRVIQMANTCPGILIFAKGLGDRDRRAHDHVLNMIVSGVKQQQIIEYAVEAWQKMELAEPATLANQRLRIQLAGPLIPSSLLWEQPTGNIVGEDIPSDREDNLIWFQMQKAASIVAERIILPSQSAAFLGFVSRHAIELHQMAKQGENTLDWFLRNLVDYVVATGRSPGRKTSPRRLVLECHEWHLTEPKDNTGFSPNQPLNNGPLGKRKRWKTRSGEIVFLETVGQLITEAQKMANCVSTHSTVAVSGLAQIFHGCFDGEPVTIEISFKNDRPVLIEARGVANAPISPLANREISEWLDTLETLPQGQNRIPRGARSAERA